MQDVPDVTAERVIAAADEGALRTCYQDQGLVVGTPEFGEGFSVKTDSLEQSRQARVVCLARFPNRVDVANTDLDDEQLRVHYDWTVQQTVPCIDGLGFDTAEPPGLDEFIAGYRADQPLWFPGSYGLDELAEIRDECDLIPPLEDVCSE